MSVASSFGFNASAVAFGGLIKPPNEKKTKAIKGNAPSVSLSPAGGFVESFVPSYKEDGISFKGARTIVEGTVESDEIYTTTTTVELEKLNVFGVLKADALFTQIQSRRVLSESDSSFTIKATIEGLRIDGDTVKVPLNISLFRKIPTYREFIAFFAKESNLIEFGEKFGWNMSAGPARVASLIAGAKDGAQEPIRCSLLTSKIDHKKGFTQDGYAIDIPNFGRVHIAEVLVKHGRRRVNLIRLEDVTKPGRATEVVAKAMRASREGSDTDTYDATICSGEGNGSNNFPP